MNDELDTPETSSIICYCNQITSDEIAKTVKETGYRTVGEMRALGSNCAEVNPSGQCCNQDFNLVINEVL